jgi:alpha-ketoglutarate-dependent taurine dioxygenase
VNDTNRPALKRLGNLQRRTVTMSTEDLVRTAPLDGKGLPLVIQPAVAGLSLPAWVENHRDRIDAELRRHGALLFRSFDQPRVEQFEQAVRAISGEMLEYKERSSPRHAVSGRIYTSTDYPADQPIFLHNENSYQFTWPRRIFFFCATPAAEGGETPIADVRRVYERIRPEVRERFAAKKWMMVRNYGQGFGLPWTTVFQTEDWEEVEDYCRRNGIEVEWREGNSLRTRAVRNAVAKHPDTGEVLWFNHATFFHVSTLSPAVRDGLLAQFPEDELPANTYYGDGSPIEPEVLDHLRACYEAETVRFPWEKGDLLMLDNMMVAHGRAPYKGERRILVAMAQPTSWTELVSL